MRAFFAFALLRFCASAKQRGDYYQPPCEISFFIFKIDLV